MIYINSIRFLNSISSNTIHIYIYIGYRLHNIISCLKGQPFKFFIYRKSMRQIRAKGILYESDFALFEKQRRLRYGQTTRDSPPLRERKHIIVEQTYGVLIEGGGGIRIKRCINKFPSLLKTNDKRITFGRGRIKYGYKFGKLISSWMNVPITCFKF